MSVRPSSPSPSPRRVADRAEPELVDWLRLHLATLYRPEIPAVMLERLGDLAGVLRFVGALEVDSRRAAADACPRPDGPDWLRPRLVARLVDPAWRRRAERELALCERHGVTLRLRDTTGWPSLLENLADMPLVLFSRGTWPAGTLDDVSPTSPGDTTVGIVGTRRPTPYGIRQARRFAREFAAAGIAVVSGLARGIDGEAHRAALEAGGQAIAVLGSGLGRVYPWENRGLARSIVEGGGGVVVSEFPWASPPRRQHFPQRNRILSGLSRGVLVIEAGQKSGSLLTVDWALGQGRPVFVLPGRVDDPAARGCLDLIQSGATPVVGPDDVLEALFEADPPLSSTCRRAGPKKSGSKDDPFLAALGEPFARRDAWHPDELCECLDMDPAELLRELTRLESAGVLRRTIGGKFIIVCDRSFGRCGVPVRSTTPRPTS